MRTAKPTTETRSVDWGERFLGSNSASQTYFCDSTIDTEELGERDQLAVRLGQQIGCGLGQESAVQVGL